MQKYTITTHSTPAQQSSPYPITATPSTTNAHNIHTIVISSSSECPVLLLIYLANQEKRLVAQIGAPSRPHHRASNRRRESTINYVLRVDDMTNLKGLTVLTRNSYGAGFCPPGQPVTGIMSIWVMAMRPTYNNEQLCHVERSDMGSRYKQLS